MSEETREENPVRCTVRTQQPTPIGELRHFLHLSQTLFVLPNNYDDVFLHYSQLHSRNDIQSIHAQAMNLNSASRKRRELWVFQK